MSESNYLDLNAVHFFSLTKAMVKGVWSVYLGHNHRPIVYDILPVLTI